MTKLAETFTVQDNLIVHKRTFDPTDAIERVTQLKSNGIVGMGDGKDNSPAIAAPP